MKKKLSDLTPDILGRYFKLDGKSVAADLYFDTFSELIDQNMGGDSVEKLNCVLFDKISEVFDLIPSKYEIRINVFIKDFGAYTVDEAQKIIKDNILLKIYSIAKTLKRKYITGLSLLGGGVGLLLASYFCNNLGLPQILFDVVNISGTLLVWESANLTIIERNEGAKRAKRYVKKFKGLTVMQAQRE